MIRADFRRETAYAFFSRSRQVFDNMGTRALLVRSGSLPMKPLPSRFVLMFALSVTALSPLAFVAQDTAPADNDAATQPENSSSSDSRSADDVKNELDAQLKSNPIIEPTRRARDNRSGEGTPPSTKVNLDPAVVGVAPSLSGAGGSTAKLRREGEFIVNRTARLVRAANGSQVTIVFESENKSSPESPLIVLPSQTLENLEDVLQERGDNTPFVASGEVTTYRGANYILLTMWTLTHDKGNLQK